MKKMIYRGEDYGFFGQNIFCQEIRKIFPDIQPIVKKPGHGVPNYFHYVFYIPKDNVTISHHGFSVRASGVDLFGLVESIEQVEKAITKAKEDYEKSHPWAKAS